MHRRPLSRRSLSRCLALLPLATCLAWPVAAQAHRMWMLPSATVLSGAEPWITVDAAISNDLFYFEHFPLRLEGLTVVGPDGSPVAIQNASTGRYRSTFDVPLKQPGTYKVAIANDSLFGSYKVGEETRRFRGVSPTAARETIPAGATEVRLLHVMNRVEVFATSGKPTDKALQATGKGLELVPVTHPTNLVAEESATFRLMLDGAPAAALEVAVVPGGIRYRDKLNEVKVVTGADGSFSVSWPVPGMYWISAAVQDDKTSVEGARRRASYNATVEVMPQ